MAPQEEIWGRKIRRLRGPADVGTPGDHAIFHARAEQLQGLLCSVSRRPILLKPLDVQRVRAPSLQRADELQNDLLVPLLIDGDGVGIGGAGVSKNSPA